MSCIPGQSWYSLKDKEGKEIENGFIAGINLPVGTIPMLLPMDQWEVVIKTGASELPLPYNFPPTSDDDREAMLIRWATR